MSHFRINFHGDEDLERRYIAALQRALDSAKRVKEGKDMNNEPVAWFEQDPDMKSVWYQSEQDNPNAIPLYTHPVKQTYRELHEGFSTVIDATHPVKELDEQFKKGFEAGKEEGWKAHKFHHPVKELTDEEIGDIWASMLTDTREEIIEFARAILRKASEK